MGIIDTAKRRTYLRWRMFITGGYSKTHVVDLDILGHEVKRADLLVGGIPLLCGRVSPLAVDHMLKAENELRPCRNCLKVLRHRS